MCVCLIQKTVSGNFGLVWFGFFPSFYRFQVLQISGGALFYALYFQENPDGFLMQKDFFSFLTALRYVHLEEWDISTQEKTIKHRNTARIAQIA